jgi:CRP/FNR family transcriptional regulator, cyclic AMP receptor protein
LTSVSARNENPTMLRRDAKVDLLQRVPLFSKLTRSELRKVAAMTREYDVREGRELTREGERGRDFTVIVEGSAIVRRSGRRVNRLGPGDFFGEISLVTGEPRTATVVAETPLRAIVLSDRDFRHLLRTTPAVTFKVLQTLGRRLPRSRNNV